MENKKKLIAVIAHDDWAEDPIENDEVVELVNISRSDINHYKSEDEWRAILKEAKEKGESIFGVSYTDHTQFYLNIGDPIDRWDSGEFGFVIVHKSAKEEADRLADYSEAKTVLDWWNSWANGSVFEVRVYEQEICHCCGNVADERIIDCCGEFYDTQAALDFIKDNYDIPEENIINEVY